MIVRLLLSNCRPVFRKYAGKTSVFALTYLAYALATGARLPYSIAKAALRPEASSPSPGWKPFTDSDGQELLGMLDTIYMFGYAGAMPFMGAIADRTHQPMFLALGMCLIGVMLVFIGMAAAWQIHFYPYFLLFTFLGGCFQSMCYPCVIAVISKWFGKSKIGFILGVWSSCTPIGTIVGKLTATAALTQGWQYAFIIPGIATVITGLVIALCLVDDPYSVGLLRPGQARQLGTIPEDGSAAMSPVDMQAEVARRTAESDLEVAVPLTTILRIPNMISYCCACFFSKLSYYAFVFWLPFYLQNGLHYSTSKAGNTSTFFDWGGFVGGIIGGVAMDRLRLRGPVLLGFQTVATAMLALYMYLGQQNALTDTVNYIMLTCLGFTVTTTYSLVTSVMATDLGRHPMLNGNSKAAATVTALLDGVGSFGAVLQGLVIGWISDKFGWVGVFIMLMSFAAFSALCLIRPSLQELALRRRSGGSIADGVCQSLQPVPLIASDVPAATQRLKVETIPRTNSWNTDPESVL